MSNPADTIAITTTTIDGKPVTVEVPGRIYNRMCGDDYGDEPHGTGPTELEAVLAAAKALGIGTTTTETTI